MSVHRRVGLVVAGAISLSLIASPLTTVAQDEIMARASDECQGAALDELLKTPGRLTVSTDNPSFGPWWGGDPAIDPESGWEFSYPPSGEGLEGGVVFAVATALGLDPTTDIDWLQNTEFALAFAPGDKPFDIHLAQISIRPERAENVNFSDPYFDANQSLVANDGTLIASAQSIEELKGFTLGTGVGTTSLEFIENVIQPDVDPQVFNDNAVAVQALDNGQIDGLVVDLGSAFFMVGAQLTNGTVVGQFDTSAQQDQLGMVMQLDSPLTACINDALGALNEVGELEAIYENAITAGSGVPVLE